MRCLIALAACLAHSVAWAEEIVVTKFNPANQHAYAVVRSDDPQTGISWADAQEFAKSIGGHLVVINDEDERRWLQQEFPADAAQGLDYHFWIGLTDSASEGTFAWVNGEPVDYTTWYGAEPNDAGDGEDYVHIYNFPAGDFAWNDLPNRPQFSSEQQYPMSALVELPDGAKSVDALTAGRRFAGSYRTVKAPHTPLVITETGPETFEIRARHWTGYGVWDRANHCYKGTYRYDRSHGGVVGYHRIVAVEGGVLAVDAVADINLPPLLTPYLIERVDGAPQLPQRSEIP